MKSNHHYARLHVYRTDTLSSKQFRWVMSDKIVDAALMLVSLAGLLCAITFLITMW